MNKFNGSFFLILGLSALALTVIIPVLSKAFHLLRTNTFYFCQRFVSNSLYYVTHPFSNALSVIILSALTLGLISFFIQFYKTQKLVKKLSAKRASIPIRAQRIIVSLGLKNKVDIVDDNNLFSFCSGIFSPRIIITTSLVANLSGKELEAVFLHEKAHLQNHDPLKILLGKTISLLFFFLPIFKELYKNMQATSEIFADRFAVSFQKDDIYLRTALKKILMTPQVNFAVSPAIANQDYLEIRINRLVGPAKVKHYIKISWISIFLSTVFILISLFLLQTPVSAVRMENINESNSTCSPDNSSTPVLYTPQDSAFPQYPGFKTQFYR